MSVKLRFSNEVFVNFAFYSALLILKMLMLGMLTIYHRVTKKVFSNQEDITFAEREKKEDEELKPKFDDAAVERTRRNHLNDLENILPFLILGFFYVLTGPNVTLALWHFRIFCASRIFHTVAYQFPIQQPARLSAHVIGLIINLSMALQVLIAGMCHYQD